MRPSTRFARFAMASIAGVFVLATAAHAATPEQKCRSTIIKESGKFVKAKAKALQKCEEAILKGKTGYDSPPMTRCSDTQGKTAAAITKAESKFKAKIDKACGGADKDCGTGDDLTLANIGWDIGQCPDFEGHGCTNPITNCGGSTSNGQGITDCLLCIDEAAVDQAMNLYYDNNQTTQSGSDENKCQITVGKESTKFLLAKSKILIKCEDKLNQGKTGFSSPCPSGDASGKTQAKIDSAEEKKATKLCKACGGDDRTCGTVDDPNISTIRMGSSCPDVQIPGGDDCGAIGTIDNVQELVQCVDCVTEFKVDCMDAAAAPGQATYSANCVGGPTPTPTATPTATSTPCPTATGLCPTTVEFTSAGGTTADLDTGWTGISHDSDVPSNGRLTLSISGCANSMHPCGQCTTTGPIQNAGGTAFNNHRCTDKPWIQCTSTADCITGGATGPCVFFFGPPLPLSSGAVPVCVTNEIQGAVTGTVNIEDGTAETSIALLSRVHPTGTVDKPCPNCVGGLCDGGPRAGQACTVNGVSALFGPVSLDCPPDPAANSGNLVITLPTSTGTQTKMLTTASPACRAGGYTGFKCFCDTCNNVNAEACSSDADCPDNPPATPGICGGTRCLGGTNPGDPCLTSGDCLGGGQCDVPGGTATAINACSNGVCVAAPGDTDSCNEGHCQLGPTDNLCSIETFRGCTNNAGCTPPPGGTCVGCLPGQTCTTKRRECYLDNGQVGGSVSVCGQANAPCNGTASTVIGALFCIPQTGSSAVNSTAGLPGLGRLTLPGTSKIQ